MKVLEKIQFICKLMGVLSESLIQQYLSYAMNGFLSWNMIFIFIFSLTYLIDNLSNLSQATYASYVIAASGLGLSQYLIFLNNKSDLKITFAFLQKLVDESKRFDLDKIFNFPKKRESFFKLCT